MSTAAPRRLNAASVEAVEACYDYCRCRYCLCFGKPSLAKKLGGNEVEGAKRSDGGSSGRRMREVEEDVAV